MSERSEFITGIEKWEGSFSAYCRIYGVSRKTGYKWLERYDPESKGGLEERSRRPHHSPEQTAPHVEEAICELRLQHPAWGGRKLHHRLRGDGMANVPAPSTITGILKRFNLLSPERRLIRDWLSFEDKEANGTWQIDFKGHFATAEARCHPLTICDDHSRFNICLAACLDEQGETVLKHLLRVFDLYGLPGRMLMDNGSPWGNSGGKQPHTRLSARLIRYGITVLHGRPYHPQSQGKEERFHRTLLLEVISRRSGWKSLAEVQLALDEWRQIYNLRRPHEALGYEVPAARYMPSRRRLPSVLPAIEYLPGDQVRKVQDKGVISFKDKAHQIGRAFVGEPVALRPVLDGVWDVYYCHQRVGRVDLTSPSSPLEL